MLGGNAIQKLSDLVAMIDKRSIRIKCLLTVMIGLPNSGTSSILMGLLKRGSRISDSNGLDIYEAVVLKDYVKGDTELLDLTDHEYRDDAMIILSLAKFLATKHYQLPDLNALLSDKSIFFHHFQTKHIFELFAKNYSFL